MPREDSHRKAEIHKPRNAKDSQKPPEGKQKERGMGWFLSQSLQKDQPSCHLNFGLPAPCTVRKCISVVLSSAACVICYSCPRKPIHMARVEPGASPLMHKAASSHLYTCNVLLLSTRTSNGTFYWFGLRMMDLFLPSQHRTLPCLAVSLLG